MLLVKVSLKFHWVIRKYAEIFCWKNVSSFCSAKATHIFSAKNIRVLCIESAKTVNEMTLNELVKLTTLWTTEPCLQFCHFYSYFHFTDCFVSLSYTRMTTLTLLVLPCFHILVGRSELQIRGGIHIILFLFLDKNICCGYSLEAPCWGASNEYPQHMFSLRNKKDSIFWMKKSA